jgi:molybdopterin-containing oxidoreductase family membrane subunit
MTAETISVMGLFKTEDETVSAIRELRDADWTLEQVHSPVPSHKIFEELKLKKSKVGYFTLAGGITGFFTGFFLAIFTATQWNLIVSGKPVIALVPFFIVGFEFTILFAIFGNVVGLIYNMQLPDLKRLEQYDARCSGDHYGVRVSCHTSELEGLRAFFQTKGGEVEVIPASSEPEPEKP